MAWNTVSLDWEGTVATLTVDRPDALNALNVETLEALLEAIARLKTRAHVCLSLLALVMMRSSPARISNI